MRRANGLDEFHSRMLAGDGVEYFEDSRGMPTIDYPHVHVVHHGSGQVDVVASRSSYDHAWRTSLRNPSGNEVQDAVRTARGYL
ncbi:hypothetical protein [Kribbella sindirgiensis]|uniref:Uncharacterized protein n=1 Tax=Kribbella sindirgiensis TaxID=1124744 RepID=A0A4R0J170_9ACTN|nr:hypothetical protein [Kribbella sindirgiensis]TCC39387.1 hypothetical protein E0H50_05480 [Kribbella sindirgiensis]